MVLTVEMVVGVLGAALTFAGLVWAAATKLNTIENKVDQAIAWINRQEAKAEEAAKAPASPARKRVKR